MKRNRLYMILPVLALSMACTREAQPDAETLSENTVLTCSISGMKTTLGPLDEGARSIYWADGDRICLNGTVSEALAGVGEGQTSATFTFDGVIPRPWSLVSPATLWKSGTAVTLPCLAGDIPMSGYATTAGTPSITAFTSILKLTITLPDSEPDTDAIQSVRVTALDGGQMSGDFDFDFPAATLTRGVSASGTDAYVEARPAQAIPAGGLELFLPVPAGNYGICVRVTDGNGHYMEKETTSAKNFSAGFVLSLPAFDFVPTGTSMTVEIASADDWNAFATKVNEKTYADGAAGITAQIVSDLDFTDKALVGITPGFKGTINGRKNETENYSFKNLSASGTNRIVGYNASGTISHVDIDASCTYDVPAWDGESMQFFALLCGQNRGTIEHCHAAHAMTFAFPTTDYASYYSGLVGRNHGTVSHCGYSGTMTNRETTSGIPNLAHIIGGVVANNYNTISGWTGPGEVSDCEFSGKILIGPNAGDASSTDCSGPVVSVSSGDTQLCVGGVCGRYATGGSFTGNSSASGSVIDVRGSYYNASIGGVIGYHTLPLNDASSVHTNNASVSFYSGLASHGFVFVGGVSGRSQHHIGYAANNGSVKFVTDQNDAVTATACGVGGIAGACYNGSAAASREFTDCVNTGDVTIENISTTAPTATSMTRWSVGGIVGYANYLGTLAGCENSGNVSLIYQKKTTKARLTYVGGILGLANGIALTVQGCINAGSVDVHAFSNYGGTTGQFQQCPYGGGIAGGIIGKSLSERASLLGCSTSGAKTLSLYGGIAGGLAGYASYATIGSEASPCSCDMPLVCTRTTSDCAQAYAGGLVGVASNSDLAFCTYTGSITGVVKAAGLAGVLTASGSIRDCVFNGSVGTVPSGSMHSNMSKYLRAPMAVVSLINATYNDETMAANFNISHCGLAGTIAGTALTEDNCAGYVCNPYDGSNTLGTSCKTFTYTPYVTDDGASAAYLYQ